MIGQCLDEIQLFEYLESEVAKKITFKVVQIKFLAIHIINKKFSFDIFTNINKISSWNINLCLIS